MDKGVPGESARRRTDRPLVVAVTGASGFVGQALVSALAAHPGFVCRALDRVAPAEERKAVKQFAVGDLGDSPSLDNALAGVDVVVHAAARAHVMHHDRNNSLAGYRKVNVVGTEHLASAAAAAGVRRIVYLSSIKVNGESTPIDRPFTADDLPAPRDAYGISKWEAENALWRIAGETGLQTVVLRPSLIYGPGVKGNLRRLIRLVERGVPLPFGAIENRRSMLAVESLVAAILAAIEHPRADGQTFLIADDEALSTPELIETIASGLGTRARLWRVPVAVIRAFGELLGRRSEVDRLTGSLVVDASAARSALSWGSASSTTDGIVRMAESFRLAPATPK